MIGRTENNKDLAIEQTSTLLLRKSPQFCETRVPYVMGRMPANLVSEGQLGAEHLAD